MSIDLTAGTLYIQNETGGEKIPVPATPVSFVDETVDTSPSIVRLTEPVEIEFKTMIDQRTMLALLLGRNITNNWLKMHGGVMS